MDASSRARSMSNYEDFKPSIDRVEEEGHMVLVVKLPGFKREQIKAQVESNGILRIRGERPIESSRQRTRFSEMFEMPEGCNVADIQAKFENETLQVRFPVKQFDVPVYEAAEPPPKPAATLPQPESSQRRVNSQPTESADARKEQKVTESVKPLAKEEQSGKPAEEKEQKPQAKNTTADELVQKANGEAAGSGKLEEKLQDKGEVAAKVDDEVAKGVKKTEKTASAMLAPGHGGGEYMARYGVGGLLPALTKEKKVLLVNLAVASLLTLALGLYLKYKN